MNPDEDIQGTGPVAWAAVPAEPLARVGAFCGAEGLVRSGERLLVACSGGADSLALLALLVHPGFAAAAGLEAGPDLVVGHVDHGLRPGSAADAGAVARLAEALGLECVADTLEWATAAGGEEGGRPGGVAETAADAVPGGVSEARARTGRLRALQRMADDVGATGVALGHTASDQLETLVMRLLRGSGLSGLAGMAPRRGIFRRPILPLTGPEARTLVAALGWRPREDPSNASDAFLRNRIRRHVVPRLLEENPRAAETAFRTAGVLQEELEALRQLEASTWERVGSLAPGGPSVAVEALQGLPAGLVTRLLRRMWRLATGQGEGGAGLTNGAADRAARAADPRLGGAGPTEAGARATAGEDQAGPLTWSELGREHVAQVMGLLASEEGSRRVDLPGRIVALRTYGRLVLCARRDLADPGDLEVAVPGPGIYPLDELGGTLEVLALGSGATQAPPMAPELAEAPDRAPSPGRGAGELPDLDEVILEGLGEAGTWTLLVRNSLPGDRTTTPAGRRKVSDLLVDRKVPQPARRRLPLLVWRGEILWIPGVWKDHRLSTPGALGSAVAVGERAVGACRLVFRRGGTRRWSS